MSATRESGAACPPPPPACLERVPAVAATAAPDLFPGPGKPWRTAMFEDHDDRLHAVVRDREEQYSISVWTDPRPKSLRVG
ncbi:hypothetical protein ABZ816_02030 [Actinosynnema sp. NPDC047251]|uniref:Uncharacterized protein n=1 Tax=Saccharothrix espanaensis (strain ATCC 51144 / DSM 44229 / JCM 9112 / NBRC 15066 / NRRL 15764) TaxID=1179773 RepID=K0JTB4_SACES|nr:hypothetical protein [Saccharothrix espanaensis]CCH31030.1 hypothetical protein BN6_37390 [Saccharothrix espanaensis DSM 44229]